MGTFYWFPLTLNWRFVPLDHWKTKVLSFWRCTCLQCINCPLFIYLASVYTLLSFLPLNLHVHNLSNWLMKGDCLFINHNAWSFNFSYNFSSFLTHSPLHFYFVLILLIIIAVAFISFKSLTNSAQFHSSLFVSNHTMHWCFCIRSANWVTFNF